MAISLNLNANNVTKKVTVAKRPATKKSEGQTRVVDVPNMLVATNKSIIIKDAMWRKELEGKYVFFTTLSGKEAVIGLAVVPDEATENQWRLNEIAHNIARNKAIAAGKEDPGAFTRVTTRKNTLGKGDKAEFVFEKSLTKIGSRQVYKVKDGKITWKKSDFAAPKQGNRVIGLDKDGKEVYNTVLGVGTALNIRFRKQLQEKDTLKLRCELKSKNFKFKTTEPNPEHFDGKKWKTVKRTVITAKNADGTLAREEREVESRSYLAAPYKVTVIAFTKEYPTALLQEVNITSKLTPRAVEAAKKVFKTEKLKDDVPVEDEVEDVDEISVEDTENTDDEANIDDLF